MRTNILVLLFFIFFTFSFTKSDIRLPKPDHIVIIMEENHGFDEIIGSPNAHYINSLAKSGALFTDSHGVVHPSQPNYLAIFSGELQGAKGDECLKDKTPYTTPNLGTLLIKAGYTFKGYAQTMPYKGYLPCYYKRSELTKGYLYGRKHCPWVNWQGDKENNISGSLSLPMTEFPTNFFKLPTVAFVIPDMDHDMHNMGDPGNAAAIRRADQWLKDRLSKYERWAMKHNSLLIITFDEDSFTKQNHIPTIFIGPMVKSGQYDMRIDHYNVLKTIEAMYSLPPSGSNNAAVIEGVWK